MNLTRTEFEKLVKEGLEQVPPEFRRLMENVEICIEDQPSRQVLNDLGVPRGETLFGLYTGVPLTERDSAYSGLPDRITIYRLPLSLEFDRPAELRREIARTVIHELAHHFGIDDARLSELGWD